MTTPSFDITPFLDQDEGQHFERKSLLEGPEGAKKSRPRRAIRDDVAENVAAFANAEGGILILGIEDEDLTVTGHKLPKRAVDDILATPRNRLIPQQPEGFVVTVGDHELIVFDVPAEVSDAISGMMRRPSRLVGNRFQETPEYPDFAWLEALFNAVAHRDYGVMGACTEIHIFDDRMEVASPGSLVDNLTLEDLLRLERVHYSRNPRIVRSLVDLGLARDQGEGIPRMFAEMADAFLPQPEIQTNHRGVSVTLRNTPTLSGSDHGFISRLDFGGLSRNEFRALLRAHRQGQIDNAGLRSLSGLDTLNASRLLRGLCDKNLLELHPHGFNSYYTLTSSLAMSSSGELEPKVGEPEPVTGELRPEVGEPEPVTGELGPEVREPSP